MILLLVVAACSSVPTADTIESRIVAGCKIDAVKAKLPHVCADPARYANDAATAAQIAQALREAGH